MSNVFLQRCYRLDTRLTNGIRFRKFFLFPALDQWRPPRVPRPKIIDGRRERTWSEHEIKVVLGELFAPKREDENVQSAIARYKVGRKVQFCLLNGVRHSEMNLIPKTGINWEARQVRIKQGKTGNYKVIGPLGLRIPVKPATDSGANRPPIPERNRPLFVGRPE